MGMNESLLFEFNHEMSITRKALERVPTEKAAFKPHEKSMPLGALASHLANIPAWTAPTILQDSLDLAPPGGEPFKTPQASTREELLAFFDRNVEEARQAIAGVTDAQLMQTWRLLMGGKEAFSAPRIGVMRGMILNHNVHHRAQLGIYLRMNGVPVPSTYGPSADESGM
jgi:uncharacterized damage-inducible protein DinB